MSEFFKTVTTTELTTQPNINGLDVLARVSRPTSSHVTSVSLIDTQVFISRLMQVESEWKSDVSALNDVVNWQQKLIDFNSSYSAYLLEQIDDDEFEKIAEAMAVEEREVDPEEIAPIMARLLKLTTVEFTPSDFANLFNCSISSVDDALHMIPKFLMKGQPKLLEASE
ncbi:hypothetical protein [Pseudomonas sp. BF-R-01]|uniref:hypothetical protein n=1 Tax=Pseudomonas sp. BF-R-01 TaxID=2832365 RepID=UPI001CC0160D|nr:hypothetical protein [Pseudomonas sp. BF-R-01]